MILMMCDQMFIGKPVKTLGDSVCSKDFGKNWIPHRHHNLS